jgi:chitodextrinase
VLAATAAGTSAIDLAWDPVADASSGVDYYTVFASDGTTLATTPETSYRVEGLAAATTYGFYLTATDIAGNTSAQSDTASATTDTGDITPPVVTLSVVPPAPDGLSGWYVTVPVPAITASTDEPATVFYSWTSEAGPWTLWADPSVPLADVPQGASTLHYYAVDTAANASTPASYALSVDTVAPTTPVLAATAAGTSAIDLAWDPVADASSGVDYYTVFASDGTTLATTPETSYRVEGLAAATTYGFYLTATDIAGNTSAQSDTASATTDTGDITPPVVTLSVVPPAPDGLSGWYVTVPAITASTDEPATVFYRFSETAEWTEWLDPAVPIPAGDIPEGVSTLYYKAIDLANNESVVWTHGFQVDTIDPGATTLAAAVAGTSAIDLSWDAATDLSPGSGLAMYEIYRSPENSLVATTAADITVHTVSGLSSNTLYEFYVKSVDIAGNKSQASNTASATTDPDDTSAPQTTLSVQPAEPDGENGWYRTKPVTITLTPDSEIASTVYYAWGGEPADQAGWQEYTAPLGLTDEGVTTLHYYAEPADAFRLSEPVRFETFKVDTVAPSAPASVTWLQQDADGALVNWGPSDDGALGSGVALYEVYLDGVFHSWTASESVLLTGLAHSTDYVVTVIAVDVAGNDSSPSSPVTVRLDEIIEVPQPPDRVVSKPVLGAQVFVAWGPSPTVMTYPVTYHVYRSSDGVAYDPVGSVSGVLQSDVR